MIQVIESSTKRLIFDHNGLFLVVSSGALDYVSMNIFIYRDHQFLDMRNPISGVIQVVCLNKSETHPFIMYIDKYFFIKSNIPHV